jgi:hypothetical protein
MDEKHRQSGFKALLASHKTRWCHLEDADGDRRLWQDLSAEGKVEHIARDAAYYDVSFEQFANAVRESLGVAAIEEAALRLALRCVRELHALERLFPDDGRTESPPPLVERVGELLSEKPGKHEKEEVLNCDKLATLFKEMRSDEAAGKREGLQKKADGKTTAPAEEKKGKDNIER